MLNKQRGSIYFVIIQELGYYSNEHCSNDGDLFEFVWDIEYSFDKYEEIHPNNTNKVKQNKTKKTWINYMFSFFSIETVFEFGELFFGLA